MAERQGAGDHIPDVAVRRLPVYLRVLEKLYREGTAIVSSAELSRLTGFSSEQIRKDLTYFGAFGTRGVGYSAVALISQIRRILGLDQSIRAAVFGAGNLGQALVRYHAGKPQDVPMVALFDRDPEKIGRDVHGLTIAAIDDLPEVLRRAPFQMAILTVPAEAAQEVAERVVAHGIRAILNFAPVTLRLPDTVFVRNVDLSLELQSLAYYVNRRPEDAP